MASTYPTQSQPNRIGDFLTYELHPGYNRVSAKIKNGSGAAVDLLDPVAYPVKSDGSGGYEFAVAGDEASVIGAILFQHEISVANGSYSAFPVPVLVRGPALYDSSILPADDVAGAAFTLSTLKATLKALNIIEQTEPGIQATQTS